MKDYKNYQPKLTIKDGTPSPLEGIEGSFTLRKLRKGLFLFIYYSKKWWKITQLTDFINDGSTNIRNTTQSAAMANEAFSNLTINGKTNINPKAATSDTDKFLVSDNKEVKYRTGTQLLSDLGITAGEIIDWTSDQGSTNIHTGNYTNTTYSEATGSAEGLMSVTHHDKLDGIEASATADQTRADVEGLAIRELQQEH